ncbi:MAG: ABC transporter substrate-binding protein [Gammaproteobacteria bacterium]|jgi:phospholipid transport system substrate-binding protein
MTSFISRPALFLLLTGILLSAQAWAAEDEHPAMKLVKETTDQIRARIKEEDKAIKADNQVLYDLVTKIVLPHFDFRRMSSWVLGRNWRKATEQQKEKFTDEFSHLLVRTYSKALYDNIDQKINFLPMRGKPDGDDVTVRTEVPQQGGFPIPIDYKMHKKKGEWKVYDVVIDSISLVSNYRSSFNQEIKKSGIDSLIASLAERNQKPIDEKSGK